MPHDSHPSTTLPVCPPGVHSIFWLATGRNDTEARLWQQLLYEADLPADSLPHMTALASRVSAATAAVTLEAVPVYSDLRQAAAGLFLSLADSGMPESLWPSFAAFYDHYQRMQALEMGNDRPRLSTVLDEVAPRAKVTGDVNLAVLAWQAGLDATEIRTLMQEDALTPESLEMLIALTTGSPG